MPSGLVRGGSLAGGSGITDLRAAVVALLLFLP